MVLKERFSKLTNLIKNITYGLKLSFISSPMGTILITLCFTFQKLPFVLNAYAVKKIIDSIIISSEAQQSVIIIWSIVLVLSFLVQNIFHALSGYLTTYLQRKLESKVDFMLIDRVHNSAFEFYDNPDNLNALNMFQRSWGVFNSIVFGSLRVISSFISSLTIFVALFSYFPILSVLVVVSVIPSVMIESKFNYLIWLYDWEKSDAFRKSNLLYAEICDRNKVLEMKLYDNYKVFTKDYFSSRAEWFDKKMELIIKNNRILFLSSLLQFGSVVLVLIGCLVRYSMSLITVGSIQFLVSIALQLRDIISDMMSNGSSVLIYSEQIQLAREFLGKKVSKMNNGLESIDRIESIEFKDVSFSYPNSDKKILDGCSFSIDCNENVSLVGMNGSGKSTIVKLLVGLYNPDEGSILINGTDINHYSREDYLNCISSVFQDYNTYSLSLKDNIILSDVMSEINEHKLKNACNFAGVDEIANGLDNGLETNLTRMFDSSGFVPSVGESQKIAIARARYRDRDFVIFDEPLASVDPISESKLIENRKAMSSKKSSITISHRLSNIVDSDKILLLNDGCVYEQGSHDELMKNKSMYYKMFKKQADKYLFDTRLNE